MIAYAYLRRYQDVAGVVIIDVVIPGLDPWDEVIRNPCIWHFALHTIPRLPELLVQGHQAPYLDYFFDVLAVKPGAHHSRRARRLRARIRIRRRAHRRLRPLPRIPPRRQRQPGRGGHRDAHPGALPPRRGQPRGPRELRTRTAIGGRDETHRQASPRRRTFHPRRATGRSLESHPRVHCNASQRVGAAIDLPGADQYPHWLPALAVARASRYLSGGVPLRAETEHASVQVLADSLLTIGSKRKSTSPRAAGFSIVAVGALRAGLPLRPIADPEQIPGATRAASYRKREALGEIACRPAAQQTPGRRDELS
jgi:hypothetical protein